MFLYNVFIIVLFYKWRYRILSELLMNAQEVIFFSFFENYCLWTCAHTHAHWLHPLLQYKLHAWAPLWLLANVLGCKMKMLKSVYTSLIVGRQRFSNCTLLVSLAVLLWMSPEFSSASLFLYTVPQFCLWIQMYNCLVLPYYDCHDFQIVLYSQTAVSQIGLEAHSEWEVNYFM
jgi:hypothetical protein